MTRKISELAAKALINKYKFSRNNTKVYKNEFGCWVMTLHDYIIGKNGVYGLEFNFKGWATQTTRNRIEAFTNYNFNIHYGKIYYNKIKIDEYKWYRVDTFEQDIGYKNEKTKKK